MLEKEFDYYLNNQKELSKKYPDKFIVIVGEQVVADYPTYEEALYKSKNAMPKGTFLIQRCLNSSIAYTSTFHSNVFLEDVAI